MFLRALPTMPLLLVSLPPGGLPIKLYTLGLCILPMYITLGLCILPMQVHLKKQTLTYTSFIEAALLTFCYWYWMGWGFCFILSCKKSSISKDLLYHKINNNEWIPLLISGKIGIFKFFQVIIPRNSVKSTCILLIYLYFYWLIFNHGQGGIKPQMYTLCKLQNHLISVLIESVSVLIESKLANWIN